MVVKKNTKFWIGIEVEGRLKGLKTLFIVGNQSIDKVRTYKNLNNVQHLYFGAGNQSRVSDFSTLLYFAKQELITFEVEAKYLDKLPIQVLSNNNIHLIITFKVKNLKIKENDSIKIEDSTDVYMISKCNMFLTDKEIDYQGDKAI